MKMKIYYIVLKVATPFCITLLLSGSNFSFSQLKQIDILSRQPLPASSASLLGISKTHAAISYKMVQTAPDKVEYKIDVNGASFTIDALSNIEYAPKADRLITFGDSLTRHVVFDVNFKIYSGTGTLIKSLNRVASWPFVTEFSQDGYFIVVGNKNREGATPAMALMSFDPNGNKQWEKALPGLIPVNVYAAPGNAYIAIVLYDPATSQTTIQYYNNSGNLIYADHGFKSISGIEFLPSGKVVIASADTWHLYNLTGTYTRITSGILKGNAVGRYPVTAHPSKDIFFIISVKNTPSNNGHRIQAFNGSTGQLIAEKEINGQAFWQPYRLLEISDNDKIRFLGTNELVEMRISQ